MRWALVQTDGPSCVKVTFQPAPSRFWPPDVLRQQPIDPLSWAGRNVTIGGPGAVWMYAHVAALAVKAHAASIWVKQADDSETFVYPLGSGAPGTSLPWIDARRNVQTGLTLVFRARTDEERWPSAVLNDLPSLLLGEEQTLCLTGAGANWMYGAAAACGVSCGSGLITCFSPRENAKAAIVIYDAAGHNRAGTLVPCPGEFLDYPANGLILGIVGDPNSGKSVLARSLDYIRKQEALDGWILDCDGCSPTPNWYLQMVQGGRKEEGQRLRSSQKRRWSPELASAIVEHLRNLRQAFRLVIADLPGGIIPLTRLIAFQTMNCRLCGRWMPSLYLVVKTVTWRKHGGARWQRSGWIHGSQLSGHQPLRNNLRRLASHSTRTRVPA
jgi:hypothetical protein